METDSIWSYPPKCEACTFFPQVGKFRIPIDFFDKFAIFVIESGRMVCAFGDGEPFFVSDGELVVCPPGVSFHKEVVRTVDMYLLVYSVDPKAQKHLPALPVKYPDGERFAASLADMKRLLGSKLPYLWSYIHHIGDDLWYQLCRGVGGPCETAPEISDPEVREIVGYINANYRSPDMLTVEELVHRSGYSHLGIINKFKRSMRMTPTGYIILLRMSRAKRLLAETELAIKDISADCGYENEYYFSNAFKKHAGMSPANYRKYNTV